MGFTTRQSSHITAQLRAADDARAALKDMSHSKEMEAAINILKGSRVRSVTIPSNCAVWCPLMNLDNTGSPQEPNPLSLAKSINDKYIMKEMDWAKAMSDDLASIAVAGVWWSGKQRPVPVTLITQATVDRLPQLYSQCKSWQGPLSAVLYLGLFQETMSGLTRENKDILESAAIHITSFFVDMDRDKNACKLDIMLVYEVFTERKAMMLYPINVLRNYARLQARTPLVALVDVDMLMSSGLYRDLRTKPSFVNQILDGAKDKTAFVLPAFETYGQTFEAAALADVLVTKDKQFIVENLDKHIMAPFDNERFPQGHNWTLFDRWYTSDESYQVPYGNRYEPWTIVDRHVAPWHDTRFRGYGQNKIVHIAHMNATDFKFVVLGNAFIIHRSHEKTTSRLRLVASKTIYDVSNSMNKPVDKTSIYGHTKELFDTAKQLMEKGKFNPVLDLATINGQQKLSWWHY